MRAVIGAKRRKPERAPAAAWGLAPHDSREDYL